MSTEIVNISYPIFYFGGVKSWGYMQSTIKSKEKMKSGLYFAYVLSIQMDMRVSSMQSIQAGFAPNVGIEDQ